MRSEGQTRLRKFSIDELGKLLLVVVLDNGGNWLDS